MSQKMAMVSFTVLNLFLALKPIEAFRSGYECHNPIIGQYVNMKSKIRPNMITVSGIESLIMSFAVKPPAP